MKGFALHVGKTLCAAVCIVVAVELYHAAEVGVALWKERR